MRLLAIFAGALALAACASHADRPDAVTGVRKVNLPTAVSCVPAATPAAPGQRLARARLHAAKDAAERYQLLGDFWITWSPWIDMAAPLIETCRAAAPAPAAH